MGRAGGHALDGGRGRRRRGAAVGGPGAAARRARVRCWSIGGVDVITRIAAGTTVLGLLPVVPMTLISALLMFVVSSRDARVAARRRPRSRNTRYRR